MTTAFSRRLRTRKLKSEINVVPYIDVMLVLLVIFMITAPLVNPGQIELPSVGSKLSAPVAPLTIEIRKDSTLWLKEGAQRAMRATLAREVDRLEHNLELLANVGSTAPYIGLVGPVFGIMISFHGLANNKQATIASVAPGISEALIATAMGLFAAIPAVWAYNRFATRVERLSVRYESFAEEFSSILQRQSHIDEQ